MGLGEEGSLGLEGKGARGWNEESMGLEARRGRQRKSANGWAQGTRVFKSNENSIKSLLYTSHALPQLMSFH